MSPGLRRPRIHPRSRRLRIESLESRSLLSSLPLATPATAVAVEPTSQLALLCDSGGDLWRYSFKDGSAKELTITSWPGSQVPAVTDVAFDGSGLAGFYGINSQGHLYHIALATDSSGVISSASITEVSAAVPKGLNSLGYANGMLWAANSSSLYRITTAGEVSEPWALTSSPAGDIEFYSGSGYIGMTNGTLLRFDPANPATMTSVAVTPTVGMGGLAYGSYGSPAGMLGFSGRNVYKLNVSNPSYWTWGSVGSLTFSVVGAARVSGSFSLSLEPEIVVTGRDQVVANGDATPSASDGTSFGIVTQGALGPARTFTVHNTGTAPLTTGSLTLPAGYVVTEALAAEIAAGASDDFTIQLNTASLGRFAGDVSFENNDADGGDGVENPFHFRISGTVIPAPQPEIVVGGSGNFGVALKGSRWPSRTFVVFNVGNAPLVTGTIVLPAGFVLTEPLNRVIPARGLDTFTVKMVTVRPGIFRGDLLIPNNDGDRGENPYRIRLSGVVIGPLQVASLTARDVTNGAAYLDAVLATQYS